MRAFYENNVRMPDARIVLFDQYLDCSQDDMLDQMK